MRNKLRDIYLRFMGLIKRPEPGVHIINSHYISPYKLNESIDKKAFEDFLSFLSLNCRFITLEEAISRLLNEDIPMNEALIAFTFDDGFEECFTIIAPLLEKYNTRGAFFINANYIDSGTDYQNQFNKRTKTYTKSPMNWDQIKELHKRGHVIGSHTLDHVNALDVDSIEYDFQLKINKLLLEEKLNYTCDYFAWTYGQLKHFPEFALKISQKYHKFIFSGDNYQHYFSNKGQIINRRHIEAFWPKSHVNYFLSIKKKYE